MNKHIQQNFFFAIKRLVSSIILRLPFDIGNIIKIKIKVQDYYILLRNTTLSLSFFRNPESRKKDYLFLKSYLQEGDNYIDIGANIGTTLIPAAKIIKTGKTLGFEPHPRIYQILKENIAVNNLSDQIKLHNCALGKENAILNFSSKQNDDTNNILVNGKGIKVPVKKLDDFEAEFEIVNLLKIDVEGFEKFILQGGHKMMYKTECIYFEVSEDNFKEYGYSIQELLHTIELAGFKLFISQKDQILIPVSSQTKFNEIFDRVHTNVLAIRDITDFIDRTQWFISGLEPTGE